MSDKTETLSRTGKVSKEDILAAQGLHRQQHQDSQPTITSSEIDDNEPITGVLPRSAVNEALDIISNRDDDAPSGK